MLGTAKDTMTSNVKSIGPEESIQAATEILAEDNISGLPVVDENGKVIGIISSSDIVEFSNQSFVITLVKSSGWVSPYSNVAANSDLKKGFEMLKTKKVKDIMTKKVVTVQETADIREVAKIMSKKNINRVPVVDHDGVLVGLITRSDLIDAMAR